MKSYCVVAIVLLALQNVVANINPINGRFLAKTLLTMSGPSKPSPKKPVIKFIDGSNDDDDEPVVDEKRATIPQRKADPTPIDMHQEKDVQPAPVQVADESRPESPSFVKPSDLDDKVAELEKLGWPTEIAKKALIACSYDVEKAAEFLEVQEEETDIMRIQAQELVLQGWNEAHSVHAMMQTRGNLTAAQIWLETRENQLMTSFNQTIGSMVKGGWNEVLARKAVLSQWEYDRKKSQGVAAEEDGLTSEQMSQLSPSMRLQQKAPATASTTASSATTTDATSDSGSSKSASQSTTPPPEAKREDVIFEVTSSNFQALVMDSKVPVLIDIYADWCGPCKQLTPILESAAVKAGGLFRLAKVNADNDRSIVDALEVTGFPTVFVWNKGKLIDRIVGFPQGDVLQKALMFAVMGTGKRHSESELTEKELNELTRSITSLAGLASISFGTKSRMQQLIDSLLKNVSHTMTPGLNRALNQIGATQKDIWLKQNRVLNITSDELLQSDKQAQLLLEIAGFKPVLFDEQHQPLSMELSHYNVAVLNLVIQHVADTLKKAKFASINAAPSATNTPVVSEANKAVQSEEPVKPSSTTPVDAANSRNDARAPVAATPVPVAAVPQMPKPVASVAPQAKAPPAAAIESISVTFRSLDNSFQRVSVSAAQSRKMCLRDVLKQLTASKPFASSHGWRVQIRHPTSVTVNEDSEILDSSVASIAGKGSALTLQELEPSKQSKLSSSSGSLMNHIKKSVGLASAKPKSAVGATHTLFSRGLRKGSDQKRNEYFGGDSTVFLSKLDEDEKKPEEGKTTKKGEGSSGKAGKRGKISKAEPEPEPVKATNKEVETEGESDEADTDEEEVEEQEDEKEASDEETSESDDGEEEEDEEEDSEDDDGTVEEDGDEDNADEEGEEEEKEENEGEEE